MSLDYTYIYSMFKIIFNIVTYVDIYIMNLRMKLLKYFDKTELYHIRHNMNKTHEKVFKISYIPLYFTKEKKTFSVSVYVNTEKKNAHLYFYEYYGIYDKKFKRLLTNMSSNKWNQAIHNKTFRKFDIFSIENTENKFLNMNNYITNTICFGYHLSLVFKNCVGDIKYIDDNLDEIRLSETDMIPTTSI